MALPGDLETQLSNYMLKLRELILYAATHDTEDPECGARYRNMFASLIRLEHKMIQDERERQKVINDPVRPSNIQTDGELVERSRG